MKCLNILFALLPYLLLLSAAKASTGYEGGARTVYTTPAFDKQWYAGQLLIPATMLHSLVTTFHRILLCVTAVIQLLMMDNMTLDMPVNMAMIACLLAFAQQVLSAANYGATCWFAHICQAFAAANAMFIRLGLHAHAVCQYQVT